MPAYVGNCKPLYIHKDDISMVQLMMVPYVVYRDTNFEHCETNNSHKGSRSLYLEFAISISSISCDIWTQFLFQIYIIDREYVDPSGLRINMLRGNDLFRVEVRTVCMFAWWRH